MCFFIFLAKYLKNIFTAWLMKMLPYLISKILYFVLWRELQDKEMKYYNNFWDTCGLNISNKTSCEVILKCPGTKPLSVITFNSKALHIVKQIGQLPTTYSIFRRSVAQGQELEKRCWKKNNCSLLLNYFIVQQHTVVKQDKQEKKCSVASSSIVIQFDY